MKSFAKRLTLLLCLILLAPTIALSQDKNSDQSFNTKEANKAFDKISIQLSIQNLKANDLVNAVTKLEALQEKAKTCLKDAENKIKEVDNLLKSSKLDKKTKQDRLDYQYLQNRKSQYIQQASNCRVFVFRSQEAITAYNATIQKLTTSKLFHRDTPIWKVFDIKTTLSLKNVSLHKVHLASGIQEFTTGSLLIFFGLIVLALIGGTFLVLFFKRWEQKLSDTDKTTAHFLRAVHVYIPLILIFTLANIFFTIYFINMESTSSVANISYAALIYLLILTTTQFLFYPPKSNTNPLNLPTPIGKQFFIRITWVASLLLLGYSIATALNSQDIALQLAEILRTLYISAVSLAIVWLGWLFSKLPILDRFNHGVIVSIRVLLILLLFTILTAEWLGYHRLALFVINAILYTTVLIVSTWVSVRIIRESTNNINYAKSKFSRSVRFYLGLRPNKTLPEALILKFTLYLIIFCIFSLLLLKIWGVSITYISSLKAILFDGFYIANLNINPYKVIWALLAFVIVAILGRLTAAYVTRRHQFQGEYETQVAVATIITYVSFSIAFLLGLLIAGVDFTGLAIIAGGLSVGIGLGMQTIANNIVSGIILLLEKPIKPGDRVIVGDTEGFVKKVRLRSTQITTLAREDVIVPNAELITNKVTNFMFRDKHWRLTCQVGVAYGSNVELIRKKLLEVAANHEDVLQEGINKPVVVFKQFGDSNLVFELWCIIRDVNKKYHVTSDLHFEIDKIFRENNITIAFPQRDLHIKDYSGPQI